MNGADSDRDQRILVLAPRNRDAEVTEAVLRREGFDVARCDGIEALCEEMARGAGTAMLTQEALTGDGLARLRLALAEQPAWSDLPVIVLTQGGVDAPPTPPGLAAFGELVLVERPVRIPALLSILRSALRGRQRQYQMRDQMAALEATAAELSRSRSQLREIADSVPALIAEIDVDQRYTFVNAAYARWFGRTTQEMIGLTVREVMGEETYALLKHRIRRALKGDGDRFEARVRRPLGGDWCYTDAFYLPKRDAGGRVIGYYSHVTDITDRRKAEEALRLSDERFRMALSAAPVTIWGQDRELRYAWLDNPMLLDGEAVLGRTDAELLERPDEAERLIALKQRVMERGMGERAEVCIHEDGQPRYFDLAVEPWRDVDGQVQGVLCASYEVTERVAVTEALAESEARFRTSVDSLLDAFGIYAAIRDGNGAIVDFRIEYVNEAACVSNELGRAEQVGQRLLTVLPDVVEMGLFQRFCEVTETGRPFVAERLVHRSERAGWRFPRAFDIRAVRYGDGVVVAWRDVTDRLRDERAVRESEARFRGIFDQAAVGIAQISVDGYFMLVNQALCDISGYSRAQLLGLSFGDVTHPNDLAEQERQVRLLLSGEVDSYSMEKRYVRPDGRPVWVSSTWSAVRDRGGEPLYLLAVVVDVEQRRRAELALRALNETLEQRVAERTAVAERRAEQLRYLASELTQAEQRERRRLAGLLHDGLQQILVGIQLRLLRLERHTADDAELSRLVGEVDGLLADAIAASRTLTIELSPPILYEAGLGPALRWLAEHRGEKQGLRVELDLDPRAEPASDDLRLLLFQAIGELLFNVVKHAGCDQARVTTRHESGWIDVVVEDQGSGFDPEATPREQSGGGFGLFSIEERIGLLGGSLTLDSAPGEGTRAWLRAPMGAAALALAAGEAPDSSADGAVRVLLVDDHAVVRSGLASVIGEQSDLAVIGEAADGLSALEAARRLRPDVVVLDVTMPVMGGVETARRLRQELPRVRVVGLSMSDEESIAEAMRDAGAVAFVSKGGPVDELLEAIRQAAADVNAA